MAETAVGLFKDTSVSDAVVEALQAHGFTLQDIRVVVEPKSMAVKSSTSTPIEGFVAGLSLDLRSIGATDHEIEAYLEGIRQGRPIVFATGAREQADTAVSVMNQCGAIVLEEYAAPTPLLPGTYTGDAGLQNVVPREIHARAERRGARLFTW